MLEISITRDYQTSYKYEPKKSNKNKFNSMFLLPAILNLGNDTIEKTTEVVEQVQEIDKGVLETIAEFCATTTKFIKDTIWCFQNPINVLVIILEWMAPLMFTFATIVPIIGLTCLVCKTPKLAFWSTKELIVSPFIIYIIYIVTTLALKSII